MTETIFLNLDSELERELSRTLVAVRKYYETAEKQIARLIALAEKTLEDE